MNRHGSTSDVERCIVLSKILVASLGFDERHVIRSVIGMGMGGIDEIILLVPDWGLEERTIEAIEEIEKIAELAGISSRRIRVEKIKVEDFWKAVSRIIELLREGYMKGVDEIIVSLGGGLRILVLETYTAVILIEEGIRKKIKIKIDIETKGKGPLIEGEEIPLCIELTPTEKIVLREIVDKRKATLKQLTETLEIPRSTIWKILSKLVKKKLLIKHGKQYTPTKTAETLIKIKPT